MTREELRQRYDVMKIGEIESEIKEKHGLSFAAQKEVIYALSYLRASGRYKENPQYRKSSFETYILGQYNMKVGTFLENERAVLHYPEVAEKYGIGLVAKVHRKCGVKKAAQVFREIKEVQGSLKTPIKRAKIESVIEKHSAPLKPKVPAIDWRERYEREAAAHMDTKRELKEARAQIERLKATVLELRPLRDMAAAIEPFMLARQKPEQRVS